MEPQPLPLLKHGQLVLVSMWDKDDTEGVVQARSTGVTASLLQCQQHYHYHYHQPQQQELTHKGVPILSTVPAWSVLVGLPPPPHRNTLKKHALSPTFSTFSRRETAAHSTSTR